MSRELRTAGLSFLLSVTIVATASLTARLYKERHDAEIAQAKMTEVACVR